MLGVFGLSIRTDQPQLEDLFAQYGRVVKAVIVFDQRVSALKDCGWWLRTLRCFVRLCQNARQASKI